MGNENYVDINSRAINNKNMKAQMVAYIWFTHYHLLRLVPLL